MDILAEFEKRYKGDPGQTEAICAEIAQVFNLDPDEVANYVYIHRYEDSEDIPDFDCGDV